MKRGERGWATGTSREPEAGRARREKLEKGRFKYQPPRGGPLSFYRSSYSSSASSSSYSSFSNLLLDPSPTLFTPTLSSLISTHLYQGHKRTKHIYRSFGQRKDVLPLAFLYRHPTHNQILSTWTLLRVWGYRQPFTNTPSLSIFD